MKRDRRNLASTTEEEETSIERVRRTSSPERDGIVDRVAWLSDGRVRDCNERVE